MTSRSVRSTSILILCLLALNCVGPACRRDDAAAAECAALDSSGPGAVASESAERGIAVRLRPILAASAFALAAVAVVLEIESDRGYARYLDTADPRLMSSYYDTAERNGDLSTAALIGAELCAVALVSTYLLQKRPAEPEPGSVIIGLAATPGAVALRLEW